MLRYMEFGLSPLEVPGESSLCIYVSGCSLRCADCHYPELQSVDEGEILSEHFENMLALYQKHISCVCFMGEGDASCLSKKELQEYQKLCHERGYKFALYSGRNTEIEDWMLDFDYVKVGSYIGDRGSLSSPSTNQRMFMKHSSRKFFDITYRFRE